MQKYMIHTNRKKWGVFKNKCSELKLPMNTVLDMLITHYSNSDNSWVRGIPNGKTEYSSDMVSSKLVLSNLKPFLKRCSDKKTFGSTTIQTMISNFNDGKSVKITIKL